MISPAHEKKYCREFGEFLRDARIDAGTTQKSVALSCGYSNAQFISNIERGLCWAPMNVLVEMCEIYGISREKMLTKLTFYRKQVWASELGLSKKSRTR